MFRDNDGYKIHHTIKIYEAFEYILFTAPKPIFSSSEGKVHSPKGAMKRSV